MFRDNTNSSMLERWK